MSEAPPDKTRIGLLSRQFLGPWLLALACLSAFLARGSQILTSEYSVLLRVIEDDTFYYLQPAWNLKEKGFYSFDGVGRTYGFQPLWMIAVTGLSWLSPDKEVFLRLTLFASLVLFLAAGIALYRFAAHEKNRLATALGVSVFWILNPWLSEVFTRGKENAIHALALTLAVLSAHAVLTNPLRASLLRWAWLGALLGFMLLARVNNLLFIFTFFALFLWRNGLSPLKPLALIMLVVALFAVAAPWFIYAQLELGTTFPTSGSAKLKSLRLEQLISLISFESISRIARSLVGVYRDVLPPAILTLLGWGYLALKRRRAEARLGLFTRVTDWVRRDPATTLLVSYAGVNIAATFVLLNPWFDYGIWYRVPEHCASVLLMTRAFASLFQESEADEVARSPHWLPLRSIPGLAFAIGTLLWTVSFRQIVPAEKPPYRAWQDRIYEATTAAPELIPKGSAIGAWNAGLIGYLLDDYTVYNLDGLANSREFLEVIGPNVGGLRLTPDHRNLADWLAENKVEYLIDFVDMETMHEPPCFRLIGFDQCRILKTVGEPMSFGPGRTIIESILELGPKASLGGYPAPSET
ncbi:MAG: hypothetical protein B6A08_09495 [Sorangiineae bacterium NIC37A_2]|nr:MAG: hypothetical protein B6A08_09495 [Sorangiineae bacterium NIC37A_2]